MYGTYKHPAMSSTNGQRLNYLGPSYNVISGSLRSCGSSNSSTSSRAEAHINGAFEDHDVHEYDSIKAAVALGPRRKRNFIYEQAAPSPTLPLRTRKNNESVSDRSSRSSSSSAEPLPKKGGTYLSRFMVFIILVILAVSVAALVLVILTITGTLGPRCGCTEEDKLRSPVTGMSGGVSVQSLLRRIQDLERNMLVMKAKMEARHSAVDVFVKKHENQVEFLQKQVSVQGRLINETASRVAFMGGSSEKKLSTEIKLLNKSVKALKNSDSMLTTTVNALRQSHSLAKRKTDRLTANVTQLQSRVQELTKSNGNMSTRAGSLERENARMNTAIKTLQAVNGAQNISHESLLSGFKRLKDSVAAVNSSLSRNFGGKAAANFSSCEHRMLTGTPVSSGAVASVSYTEPLGKRVVGITCSTDFAGEYKLESQKRKGYYECTCRGVAKSAESNKPATIHCYLHLWECSIN